MIPYWRDEQRDLTIYHGDCREVMAGFGDGEFDSVITDPPYGVGKKEHLDVPPDNAILAECLRVATGTVLMWSGAPLRSLGHYANLEPEPNRVLTWTPSFSLAGTTSNGIVWKWHPIFCWRLPPSNSEIKVDVLRDSCDGFRKGFLHVSAKPERVMVRLCRAFGGSSVLDPYLGSGTTLAACASLGIRGVGIELEEKYCEMAAARLSGDVTYGEELTLFNQDAEEE